MTESIGGEGIEATTARRPVSDLAHRVQSTRPVATRRSSVFGPKRLIGGGLLAHARRQRRLVNAAASERGSGRAAMLHVLALLVLMTVVGVALSATSTDTDFQGASDQLASWLTGSLGSVLRMGMFLVGMAIGIVTQRIVVPLFSTLVLFFAPAVVDSIFTALI